MTSFESSIKRIIKPSLEKLAFQYDGNHIFRRLSEQRTEIIEFQKGVRSLQGLFCINIGLYTKEDSIRYHDSPQPEKSHIGYCSFTTRVGCQRETILSRVARIFLGPPEGTWKTIFIPRDQWWDIPLDEQKLDALMQSLVNQIIQESEEWFKKTKT